MTQKGEKIGAWLYGPIAETAERFSSGCLYVHIYDNDDNGMGGM